MSATPEFTVLVNSSDGFEDCWKPFFTLFSKYWLEAHEPILLNTEKKIYQHPGLPLQCTQVQNNSNRRLTWSECLLAALDQVKTPLVLYFQEDYFIHQHVLDAKVRDAARFMLSHPDVKHIALTGFGSAGPYAQHSEAWLQIIGPDARYRVSTQAALWRVETLRSYLVPEENGWMFEIYGTWRAHRRREQFLVVCHSAADGGVPIGYLHTGIIKGQWLPAIKQVFDDNAINVDFDRRGIYVPKNLVSRKIETARRLLEKPAYLFKNLVGLR